MNEQKQYSSPQTISLFILRLVIGWHFLYEGITKLLKSDWTAYPYLMDSQGMFADWFYALADNPTLLAMSNFINVWGLTLVGLFLILGFFSRCASIGGIIFLSLFYLSHIPFIGAEYMMPAEGSYLWIDKNIIEIAALLVLIFFPTSHIIGLDQYVNKIFKCKKA